MMREKLIQQLLQTLLEMPDEQKPETEPKPDLAMLAVGEPKEKGEEDEEEC